MITEQLLNYGVLGLWTATLIYEKYKFQKEIIKVLKDNTQILRIVERRLQDGRRKK